MSLNPSQHILHCCALQAVYGKYSWQSYAEVNERVINTCSGLLVLASELQTSNSAVKQCHVCIFAETRAEWIISVFACFKANLPGMHVLSSHGLRVAVIFSLCLIEFHCISSVPVIDFLAVE